MSDHYYAYQSVILNVDYYPQPDNVRVKKFGRLINCFSKKYSFQEPKPYIDKGKDAVLNHILTQYI